LNLVGSGEYCKDYDFSISKSGQLIKLKLPEDGKTIIAETVINNINPDIIQILRASDYDSLNKTEQGKLREITKPIVDSMRELVGLIKQEHTRFDISDSLIGNVRTEWSLGAGKWYSTPYSITIEGGALPGLGNMDDKMAQHLQELLSKNEQPLVAINYLHQAINSNSTRYQWIYATISAELAIKEILIRIEPKLEVILSTLPSPPLERLYGDVLESLSGVKPQTSDLNRLKWGAIRRNKLIHSIENEPPSFEEANEYNHFINDQIKWLLYQYRHRK